MTFGEAQRTYLVSQPQFQNLVGARLTPEVGFQDETSAFVAYHVEIREAEQELEGPAALLEAKVEYSCYSNDSDEAFQIAEVLRSLLSYFQGSMGTFEIQSCMFDESVGGYIPDIGLFVTECRFTFQFPPQ